MQKVGVVHVPTGFGVCHVVANVHKAIEENEGHPRLPLRPSSGARLVETTVHGKGTNIPAIYHNAQTQSATSE